MLKNIRFYNRIKYKIPVLTTLIFLVFSLSGCFLIPKEEEVLAPILKEPPKVVYDSIEIKTSTFEDKIQVSGNFVSVSQVDLCFKNLSGRLKTIYVELGDEVKKGTLLADLITDDLATEIKQQEILVVKSQLALDNIKSNGQKDIYLLEKQLNSLKKKLKDMEAISEAYSLEEINDFKAQVEEKEIVYKNALVIHKNSIKAAESDLELCRIQLEKLRENLKNTQLIATIDGTVNYLTDVRQGNFIDAYTTVATISDPKNLQLQYSGDKVNEFELGMKVNVKIQDSEVEGIVVMTPSDAPTDSNEKAKSSIFIKIKELPPEVTIGTSAQITLIKIKKDDVIVLSKNVIRSVGARKFVYVLENGLKKERDIQTGDESQTETIIDKGLSVGDVVIKN